MATTEDILKTAPLKIVELVNNLNEDTEYDTGPENYASYANTRINELIAAFREIGCEIPDLRAVNSPPEEE